MERLNVRIEIGVDLYEDEVARTSGVVRGLMAILDQLVVAAEVPQCAVHAAVSTVLVQEMICNGHESCAERLVVELSKVVAQRQRAEGVKFDS